MGVGGCDIYIIFSLGYVTNIKHQMQCEREGEEKGEEREGKEREEGKECAFMPASSNLHLAPHKRKIEIAPHRNSLNVAPIGLKIWESVSQKCGIQMKQDPK